MAPVMTAEENLRSAGTKEDLLTKVSEEKKIYGKGIDYDKYVDEFEIQPKIKELLMNDGTITTWNGDKYHFMRGQIHREQGEGPAVEMQNGTKEWWHKGSNASYKDHPSWISKYGSKTWLDENGLHHRDGDKPAIESHHGYNAYYNHGKQHRPEGKPAVEYLYYTDKFKNIRFWDKYSFGITRPHYMRFPDKYYENGKLHRIGGPAEINTYAMVKNWYRNGELYLSQNMTPKEIEEYNAKYD